MKMKMASEDELWEAIRTRVRNADLEIITFEELYPELNPKKILQKAKHALSKKDIKGFNKSFSRLFSHEMIDSLMRERGYGFVTNISMLNFVADQLNGCRKLKRQYGKNLCITEIALDIHGRDAPDLVGVYSKSKRYLRPRDEFTRMTIPYTPPLELEPPELKDYVFSSGGIKRLREYYCHNESKNCTKCSEKDRKRETKKKR